MPGLRPECIQATGQDRQEGLCCICEESGCSITLSPRGNAILFVDGEEVIIEGNRCDCIIVLRRDKAIETYSIELKGISNIDEKDVLNPDKLRQKWENCLRWALNIVSKFNSVNQRKFSIKNYAILAVPEEARGNIVTLIKRQSMRYRPKINAGKTQGRILSCNNSITGRADIIF
ncbi:MAG: hypothetical protein F7B11_03625 [Caldisphaeraceae archaeon]|nr:hypothetical protein [Caldisphaeraceae archaeon]